ncbi:hypothetical protein K8I28_05875 [bacterium]|nr:hypothetical protein [bacterium]
MKLVCRAILFILFVNIGAYSQVMLERNTWEFGGSFQYESKGGESHESLNNDGVNVRFTPQVGYSIADRFIVGAEVELYTSEEGTYKSRDLRFGLFGAIYHKPIGNGNPFGQLTFSNGDIKNENTYFKQEIVYTSISAGVGYFVPLGDWVSISPLLEYTFDVYKSKNASDDLKSGHVIEFSIGLSFYHKFSK